jgi:glycosyltransferase involved in cell wall biosynthesis
MSMRKRWTAMASIVEKRGAFALNATPGDYLLFLGRMMPEKRPDLAIEIARRAGLPLKIAAKIHPGETRVLS